MKRKILFVCLGNICRSPMAKYTFNQLVKQRHWEDLWEIDSCATSREEQGNPIYPPAQRKLAEYGINSTDHKARQMRREDYQNNDIIVAMDHNNLRSLRRFVDDDPLHKVHLLLDFIVPSHPRYGQDVADPWYTGDFSTCMDDILLGCKAILEKYSTTQPEQQHE